MSILDAVMRVAIFVAPIVALLCYAALAVRTGRTPKVKITLKLGALLLLGLLSGIAAILSQFYMHHAHGWLPGIWIAVTTVGFLLVLVLVVFTLISRRESVAPGNDQP